MGTLTAESACAEPNKNSARSILLTQRLGSTTQKDPAFLDSFLAAVKANPGSCDEVWLATDYGFPSLEKHRRAAETLARAAEKLRKAGLRVSLQLSNSIGHGQYMAAHDCSGLVYEGSPVEKMIGADGTRADYCFCWNGKYLREYVKEELRIYVSALRPDCVWVDDDLRPANHDPVRFGCFCPDCMRMFNERFGCSLTREELVRQINSGSRVWRQRHIEFLRGGLADFTSELGRVIHDAAPGCRMGLQSTTCSGGYAGTGSDFLYGAMRDSTGLDPLSRPGGGVYNDYDLSAFLHKAEEISYQNYLLPDYVTEMKPEIENLPDVVYGKSIGGTCFETSYYFACGNTSMSYAMLMEDYEPMSWQSQMLHAFSEHRPYWERLSALNRTTRQSGVIFALPQNAALADCGEPFGYIREFCDRALPLRFLNIPVAFSHRADGVFLLHPENARRMSDGEIRFLLGRPVITDAKTLGVLAERGFSLGGRAEKTDVSRLQERFSAHPVNGRNAGRTWCGYFGRTSGWALCGLESSAEVLGTYFRETPDGREDVPLASGAVFPTGAGAKWAVFAFDLWNRTVSTAKRDQLLNAAAYIGGRRFLAELKTPVQAVVLPREDLSGNFACASLVNCTAADNGPLELAVRDCAGSGFRFLSQYQDPVIPEAKSLGGGEYLLRIPNVRAWSVGTVFAE